MGASLEQATASPGAAPVGTNCCALPMDSHETGAADVLRGLAVPPATRACAMTERDDPTTCKEADSELDGVAEMQRLLLPAELPEIDGVDLSVFYRPSSRAGGDYYDFLPLEDGKVGVLIADVAGHGAPAAVGMAVLYALAHACPVKEEPGTFLSWVNTQLADGYAGRHGRFVTAFYAVIDPAMQEVSYASAGHPPPRLVSRQSITPLDNAQSLPLGIMAEETFKEGRISLRGGDALVLYTDGITEAFGPGREMFGTDRLDEALKIPAMGARQMSRHALSALGVFTDRLRRDDDRTLVSLVFR